MKAMQKKHIGLVLLLLLIINANGGIVKSGQTGLQFLEAGMSARAEGMGGAFTVTGSGVEAIYYNPAGLVYMDNSFDIDANHQNWIADIAYTSAATAYNPAGGTYGVFAISFRTANYGDFIGTAVDNTVSEGFRDTKIFSPAAFSMGFCYAKQLTNRFAVGGKINYVEQSLGTSFLSEGSGKKNKVSGLTFDFGTIYHTGIKSLNFGMYIRNFAGDFKYERYQFEAPLIFRIGISFDLMDIIKQEEKTSSLLFAIDAEHPRDDSEHLDIGMEYSLWRKVFIRGGYRVGYDLRSYTIGVGLKQSIGGVILNINYSYGALEFFDNVQLFTIRLSF